MCSLEKERALGSVTEWIRRQSQEYKVVGPNPTGGFSYTIPSRTLHQPHDPDGDMLGDRLGQSAVVGNPHFSRFAGFRAEPVHRGVLAAVRAPNLMRA